MPGVIAVPHKFSPDTSFHTSDSGTGVSGRGRREYIPVGFLQHSPRCRYCRSKYLPMHPKLPPKTQVPESRHVVV
jgi:hypothetical protein